MTAENATEEDASGPSRDQPKAVGAKHRPTERSVRVPFRTALNYLVDAGLAVAFLSLVWLATIERLVFPSGEEAYRFRLWGVAVDDWRRYQFGALCALSFLVVVHVTLHWNWVCSVTNTLIWRRPAGKDNGSRTLIGVGLLLLLLHVLGATVLLGKFQLAGQ